MRITAVTCIKNEGPFLLEWIAYHHVIGVTDFVFYSNDCTDGSDALLDALAAQGLVHHLPNPAVGRAYQMEALRHAATLPVVHGADWVWVADVDEFPNIHAGDHSFAALIEACDEPQAISLCFQMMANGGIERFTDRPVIRQFLQTHTPDLWTDQSAIEVKTLVRGDFPLQYYGAHRPFVARDAAPPIWTDGSGRLVPEGFLAGRDKAQKRRIPAKGARRFATLNHYALRSLESFLVKCDRGDVNRANRAFDLTYWQDRNDTAWEDRSILRMVPLVEQALQVLKSDPVIAAAHQACIAAHRDKIDHLRRDPEYQALAAALGAAPRIPVAEVALRKRLGLEA